MKRVPTVLLVLTSLLLVSCNKDIFFSNGPTSQITRKVPGTFRYLEMCDNVDINLIHSSEVANDSTTIIKITTGENLLDKIGTTIHGDTLVITNDNKLNWLRPYDYPLVATVYYDSIYMIIFNSNGNLTSDTLRGYDKPSSDTTEAPLSHLYLQVDGGSGDINLLTRCDRLYTNYNFGTSAITVKGDARIAYTTTSFNSHGPFDAQELETNIHYVYANGTSTIKVKAFHQVQIKNKNNGVNYYLEYVGHKHSYEYDSTTHYNVPTTIEVICPEMVTFNNVPYNTLEYYNEIPNFQKIKLEE